MRTLNFKVIGITPMLMHSDRFADPLNPATVAHKKLTSKRSKTADDLIAIAHSEWLGSLYYNDTLGIHVPSQNLRKNLIEGGRKFKLGKQVEAGILYADEGFKLDYNGSKDPEKLYEDKNFVDSRSVVVSRARITRYRPKFKEWSFDAEILYDETMLDLNQIENIFEKAGTIGLGDYRPLFGRYSVEFS